MKPKSTLPVLITLILATFSPNLFAEGTYSGGTGEPNDPYLIATAEDMNEMGVHPNDWDECFLLTTDINLINYNEANFNIIGYYEAYQSPKNSPFTGVFDGNGHTISNFTWKSTTADYIGLFGWVDDPNAEIKDVRLINPNVQGEYHVGALVGRLEAGTITGCGIESGVVSGNWYVGGLVGFNEDSIISNCYATSSISGTGDVGGLVGCNYGDISNCYATGDVTGTNSYVGGLVGSNGGTVSNCYATGSVTGDDRVGGLVGENQNGTISNCYATGSATGTRYRAVGGLVGWNLLGTIINCYATGNVSGYDFVGGLVGENQIGTISNCYAVGSVSGTGRFVGGLVGINIDGSTISNCYATGPVSGASYFGGFAGVNGGMIFVSFWDTESSGEPNGVGDGESLGLSGKTTTQMYSMNTYLGWGAEPAIWTIDDTNDYPHLAWENSLGEPISPLLSDFLEGSGTEQDPYLIYTPNDLDKTGLFSSEWDRHFKLMADIDLSGWSPTEPNLIGCFAGVFDGNGHSISDFTFQFSQGYVISFFRKVDDPNAEIKNLKLIDPNVQGYDDVGVLVGHLRDGTITGCSVEGGAVSGDWYVGGLVAIIDGGTISNCYASCYVTGLSGIGGLVGRSCYLDTISNCYAAGSVTGTGYVGGLIGFNLSGTISNCYATGSVIGEGDVGGLAGYNEVGIIANCFTTGPVTGDWFVGGLVGENYSGTISNCYAAGSVTGDSNVGGLVGRNKSDIFASFWDVNTTGQDNGIGGNYGTGDVYGRTTAQMQTEATFTDYGWDFVCESINGPNDIWSIHEGQDYPKLVWDLVNFVGWYEVDFVDYAFLAQRWLDDNCADLNDCDGADLDFSGSVGSTDLKIFCNHWLEGL